MSTTSEHNELRDTLSLLKDFEIESSEETFLSIGGRGYYENPTSDLLKFFLQPNKDHGFGTLFLESLLAATSWENGSEPQDLTLDSFTVDREAGTEDHKRIDLLLTGSGWLMLIENKIRHHENNPWESYGQLSKRRAKPDDQVLKLILAPHKGNNPQGWSRVTYDNFLRELSQRLEDHQCSGNEKWLYFAKDFVLHLQQDLYTRIMNPEEIAFVEEHQQQLAKAVELHKQYRKHLLTRLPHLVNELGYAERERVESKDSGWAVLVYHPHWKGGHLAWLYQDDLHLNVYLGEHNEDQFKLAEESFGKDFGMHFLEKGLRGFNCHRWTSKGAQPVLNTIEEAEAQLKEMAQSLFKIFPPDGS